MASLVIREIKTSSKLVWRQLISDIRKRISALHLLPPFWLTFRTPSLGASSSASAKSRSRWFYNYLLDWVAFTMPIGRLDYFDILFLCVFFFFFSFLKSGGFLEGIEWEGRGGDTSWIRISWKEGMKWFFTQFWRDIRSGRDWMFPAQSVCKFVIGLVRIL